MPCAIITHTHSISLTLDGNDRPAVDLSSRGNLAGSGFRVLDDREGSSATTCTLPPRPPGDWLRGHFASLNRYGSGLHKACLHWHVRHTIPSGIRKLLRVSHRVILALLSLPIIGGMSLSQASPSWRPHGVFQPPNAGCVFKWMWGGPRPVQPFFRLNPRYPRKRWKNVCRGNEHENYGMPF